MQYLTLIRVVLSLLPLVIDAVKAIEAAFPTSGQGNQKLGLIRSVLQSAYESGTGALASFDDIWPVLQKTVGAVVTFFNEVGAFKSKQ